MVHSAKAGDTNWCVIMTDLANIGSLKTIRDRNIVKGIAIRMEVRGIEGVGFVPFVKHGMPLTFSLLFYNKGKETLNVHAAFKCYYKLNGMLVWELSSLSRKVKANEYLTFNVEMDTNLIVLGLYFIESAARYRLKHVEKSTRLFTENFRVVA